MKMSFRLLIALSILAFASLIRADDFVSQTIASGQPFNFPPVHGGQFLVIKNFTQDDFVSTRGVVTVMKPPNGGMQVNVLTAAALDASPPDIINTIVIAGPALVSATCGNTTGNCFITYRKDSSN